MLSTCYSMGTTPRGQAFSRLWIHFRPEQLRHRLMHAEWTPSAERIFSHFQKCDWCLTSSPEIGPQNLSQSNGKCISSGASVTGAWVLDKRFTLSYHNRKSYYLLSTPIMATELKSLRRTQEPEDQRNPRSKRFRLLGRWSAQPPYRRCRPCIVPVQLRTCFCSISSCNGYPGSIPLTAGICSK